MAVELASAYVSIIPTTKGIAGNLEKELVGPMNAAAKKAGDEAGATMKKSLADTGKSFTRFGIGALAVAGGIGAGLLATGKAASDLGESVNAVKVTFGSAAAGILKLGEDAATSVGLSNSAFNGLAVQFSSFASTIAGKGGDVVGTMQEMTGRAADFASVMNIDVAEAARIFQSGLAGETEPLKKFGIDLSAAAVNAFAASHGIGTFGKELTETEKVTARYGLLMQSTAKTQGDFANTSDSAANATRIAKAELENASASLGAAFTPAIAFAATTVAGLAEKFSGLNDATGGWLAKGAGIAAIAIGAAGALSLVVGQVLKMSSRFTEARDGLTRLTAKFHTAEGGLTTMGKAARGVGIGLGIATVAFLAYELIQASTAAESERFAKSLDEINRATDAQAMDDFTASLEKWKTASIVGNSIAQTGVKLAERMAEGSLAAAIKIRDLASAHEEFRTRLEANGLTVEQLTAAIDGQIAADGRLGTATDVADAALAAQTGTTEDLAGETSTLQQNADALVTAIIEEKTRIDDLAQAQRDNKDAIADGIRAQRDMNQARKDGLGNIGDLDQSLRDLDTAYYNLQLQQAENVKTQKDHNITQGEKDQSNRDLLTSEHNLAEKVAETALKYADENGAVAGTKHQTDLMIDSLNLSKAKYPELSAPIDAYIKKLLAIPTNVDTVIRHTGTGLDLAAAGGTHSGPTIVGEEGPEIVDLPAGSFVHTAQQTRSILSATQSLSSADASGPPIVVNNYRRDIGVGDLNQILAMARLAA